MSELILKFNNQNYIAKLNKESGFYEVELEAPQVGGIYTVEAKFTDLFGDSYQAEKVIQVFVKEDIKIDTNKVFMWIFSKDDFSIKSIIEISDYEINIDEETNATSIIKVLKKTDAQAEDIAVIKKNNTEIFWGIIKQISSENGEIPYTYSLKYITNMFDTKVALRENTNEETLEDGTYIIKSVLDTNKVICIEGSTETKFGNAQICIKNNSDIQKWKIQKNTNGYYTIENYKTGRVLDVNDMVYANGTNVTECTKNGLDAQQWQFVRTGSYKYKIKSKGNLNYCLNLDQASAIEGNNIQIYQAMDNNSAQEFYLERVYDAKIAEEGIEDYIADTIRRNFIENKDYMMNKNFLQIDIKSHTKKKTAVTNVENNIYNFHTWITNCTQNYDITYDFFIRNKKFVMSIENKKIKKKLIDTKAHSISQYNEVFSTDIVSKVTVLTSTETYYLYLLIDRTTTTNMLDENRVFGAEEVVYCDNFEDAPQEALNVFKSNSYNHNISFAFDNYIPVGTPIAIKTKESLIYDTYISAIKITKSKFYEYTCGNIRVDILDKLKKERRK